MTYSHQEIFAMLNAEEYARVASLIQEGTYDPNLTSDDEEGEDPDEPAIHLAFFAERYDLVGYLISQGANINVLNSHGKSILNVIINGYGSRFSRHHIHMLMQFGADPNRCSLYMPQNEEHNPYVVLIEHGLDIQYLINRRFIERAIDAGRFDLFMFALEKNIFPHSTPHFY